MRPSVRALAALSAAAMLALAGCGGSGDSGTVAEPSASTPTPQTPSEPEPSSPASETASASADPTGDDDVVEVEIEIEDGEVKPAGERVDVQVGQTIRLVVDSDTADEIHVHSVPEHSFAIKAGADDKTFELTLQQPGVVEAELHELGVVVVTFAARP